ncbi:MAG: sigma-70 family RNA polymerase sigma factor [Lentisphaerales bacterium]|nr:sigma-70 family RNA polymerase sigma factor [Lentisphaerales bacterium]
MSDENWNTRLSLLQRAKNPDDHQAWDDFASYYFDFVKVILYKMGVNQNDKDDLTQEVLLSLWKSLPKFELDKSRARFRTWMSSIIHRRVVDHYRKVNRLSTKEEKLRDEQEVLPTMSEPEIENIIQSEWEAYIVKKAMQRVAPIFSGKAMEVFQMSMDNIDPDEICQKLDLKRNSVIKLKNRVKERLLVEIQNLKQELDLMND